MILMKLEYDDAGVGYHHYDYPDEVGVILNQSDSSLFLESLHTTEGARLCDNIDAAKDNTTSVSISNFPFPFMKT